MLSLSVSPESGQPLVDQIVAGIRRQIDDRHLRPGSEAAVDPQLRGEHKISRFTVVEAYDRLVAMGYLQSRRGAGFYTAAAPSGGRPSPARPTATSATRSWSGSSAGCSRRTRTCCSRAGRGCRAPGSTRPASARASTCWRARTAPISSTMGSPSGYLPLREHLALMLAGLGITADARQILLTQGTSQALELVIRYLLKPGDTALVDDPGYYNMFGNLRLQGVEMLAVPRNPDGPDIAMLEKLAAEHRPKVYFTQSVMQNPTGSDMSPHVAFKLLQAAERHNFLVVEDDIFSRPADEGDATARDAGPARPRDLRAQLLEDAVGQPARRLRRLPPGHRGRARRHQDADQHHHLAVHRAARLSDAGRRPLPQISVTPCTSGWARRASTSSAPSSASGSSCSWSPRPACSSGHVFLTSTTRSCWPRRRSAQASCLPPARSSAPISSARPGCASTSPSATTRASRAGCRARYREGPPRSSGPLPPTCPCHHGHFNRRHPGH